jgi:recombination protein RecA
MAPRKRNEEQEDGLLGAAPTDLISDMEASFKKAFKDTSSKAFEQYEVGRPSLWYPTGAVGLDIALGGGLAGGGMSEWFGNPGHGKSTLLYASIAKTQEVFPDKICVLADPENSAVYAKKHMQMLGVDFSRLFYIANTDAGKPRYAEDMFERIEFMLRNPKWHGKIAIVGIDSLGSLVSRNEGMNEKKWEKDARVGGITQSISMFLRNTVDNGLLMESQAHLFCLNQVRYNIGDQWNPWRTPGRFCRLVA